MQRRANGLIHKPYSLVSEPNQSSAWELNNPIVIAISYSVFAVASHLRLISVSWSKMIGVSMKIPSRGNMLKTDNIPWLDGHSGQ